MPAILQIDRLDKSYSTGFHAIKNLSLEVNEGEIFALLGPNGAGKTSLIHSVCGIVIPSSGKIQAFGHDVQKQANLVRAKIGLVPQEIHCDMFESVWNTVCFSRGLFGLKPNKQFIENILHELSLWDKKDAKIMSLSGGMKRRVMMAKALAHEPKLLFLDEPSAGVDVSLRLSMWESVRKLRASGVTIILTTHYLEEAEELADRIGVINKGELIVVDEKKSLMSKLGKKRLQIGLSQSLEKLPPELQQFGMSLSSDKWN